MATAKGPGEDYVKDGDAAISTSNSNKCAVQTLHDQMILHLSEEIGQSWEDFKTPMKDHIRPKSLRGCKEMSEICSQLQTLDKISFGQYDVLLDAFDDINHHACYEIVERFTCLIRKELNILEENKDPKEESNNMKHQTTGQTDEKTERETLPKPTLKVKECQNSSALKTDVEDLSTKEYNEIYEHLMETFNKTVNIVHELPKEEKFNAIIILDEACQELFTRINKMKRIIDIKKERGGEEFHHKIAPVQGKDLQLITSKLHSVGLIEIMEGIKTKSTGTGFLVGDGFLMTAYHVLKNRIADVLKEIVYGMPSGDQYKAWLGKTQLDTYKILNREHAANVYLEKQRPKKPMKQLVESFRSINQKACQDTLEKIERKWCKECVVTFGVGLEASNKSFAKVSFSIDIPFVDEENDVIILQVQQNKSTELPASFLLDEGTPEHTVNIIGYLEDEGNQQNVWVDTQCEVYLPKTDDEKLESDIQAAVNWWKTQEKALTDQEERAINLYDEYKGCTPSCSDKFGCVTVHTAKSFVHGTSGSPVINFGVVEGQKRPLVSAMYQRGYPRFYYELQNCARLKSSRSQFNIFKDLVEKHEKEDDVIDLKYFFEAGITMKRVAELLDKYSSIQDIKSLRQNIFGKEANRGKVDMPDLTIMFDSPTGGALFTNLLDQDAKYTGSLSNKVLRILASKIPTEWRGIMNLLELPQNEINIVTKNYQSDVVECAFTCLLKWRNMNAKREDVDLEKDLIEALKFEGRMDIINILESQHNITGKRGNREQKSLGENVTLKAQQPVDQNMSKATFQPSVTSTLSKDSDMGKDKRKLDTVEKYKGEEILDQKKRILIETYYQSLPASLKRGFFDVLILCHKEDLEEATVYRDHLNDLLLENNRKIRAAVFDTERDCSSESKFKKFEEVFNESTFTFLFITEKFIHDDWSHFCQQTTLAKVIEDKEKKCNLVPIYTLKREIIERMATASNIMKLTGCDYGSHGRDHDEYVRKLISGKRNVWETRNDELLEQQYREAVKIHQDLIEKLK